MSASLLPGPDQVSETVTREQIHGTIRSLQAEGYVMLSDIFGIDWLEYPRHQGPRFTVVYNVVKLDGSDRRFVRVDLEDGEPLPTITDLWAAASFMEREVFDMFGVQFSGHPYLRKLLTPEDLDGHPHRKDFPLGETPTLFNDGRFLEPASFRAGLTGKSGGLTGWKGGARRGVVSVKPAMPEDQS